MRAGKAPPLQENVAKIWIHFIAPPPLSNLGLEHVRLRATEQLEIFTGECYMLRVRGYILNSQRIHNESRFLNFLRYVIRVGFGIAVTGTIYISGGLKVLQLCFCKTRTITSYFGF